jgi:hypothetical protein
MRWTEANFRQGMRQKLEALFLLLLSASRPHASRRLLDKNSHEFPLTLSSDWVEKWMSTWRPFFLMSCI